jgi:hypothetical protein
MTISVGIIGAVIFFPMGTRRRFLRWVPYQGFGTPRFSYQLSMTATVFGHAPGVGTGEPLKRYGKRKRSIDSGVPFGKAGGCFLRAGQGPTRRSVVNSWNSRNRNRVDRE